MKLQLALDDITLDDAVELLDKVHTYVDIIEVGSPFIIEEGMRPVRIFKEKYPDCEIDFSQLDCIQIKELTTSGRVKTIKFGNKEIAGTEARTILGLKSTNFTFSIDGDNVTFSVTGYGHGVGMSQTGADALAKSGSTFEEIIKHFYTNVEIVELNSL